MSQKQYIQKQRKESRVSAVIGCILALAAHGCICTFLFVSGYTYLNPPPPEKEQILIEFEQEEVKEKPEQQRDGTQPRAEVPQKEIKLVQQSKAQNIGTKSNQAEEATVGQKGDVEIPEPPRKKEIDKRALFPTASNKAKKDTLAAQTAREVSDALKAGHALGNTKTGETSGESKAQLAGRKLERGLPKPTYSVAKAGKVVVDIWVDNYGTVQKAVAGAEGTTVTDKELWNEARIAAMKAKFNMSADAPAMQKGTITYIFKLK